MKACAFRAANPPWRRAAQAARPILRAALIPRAQEAGGRGALFASGVSLTSPLRSEVPEKTKVATSISRSIPFRPLLIKPYVSGRNADASKSGRILRFFRRSTGREKPPRPLPHHSGGARLPAEPQPARTIAIAIIANIRNKAGFRSRDPLRRKSEWPFAATPSPIANHIAMLIRLSGEFDIRPYAARYLAI